MDDDHQTQSICQGEKHQQEQGNFLCPGPGILWSNTPIFHQKKEKKRKEKKRKQTNKHSQSSKSVRLDPLLDQQALNPRDAQLARDIEVRARILFPFLNFPKIPTIHQCAKT